MSANYDRLYDMGDRAFFALWRFFGFPGYQVVVPSGVVLICESPDLNRDALRRQILSLIRAPQPGSRPARIATRRHPSPPKPTGSTTDCATCFQNPSVPVSVDREL